jgi:hypothetical protein
MNSYPLTTNASVTLGGSGNGTVSLGPQVGQRWRLRTASILIPNAILIPQCKIYMGGAALDPFFIDGTYTGALASTSNVNGRPLTNGQRIFAVWTGGNPGAVATLTIAGTVETGRQ